MRHAIAFLILSLSASCGGGGQQTPPVENPTAAVPSASTAPSVTPPPTQEKVAWKDMSKDQRKQFMKDNVMPKMAEEFQAFDGKKYAEFSCKTCHGEGAKDGSFKMPNPNLPKLPMDHNAMMELAKKKADAAKFMATKVKPDMANLLGEDPWDEQHPTGFGCGACHEMQK